MKFKIIFTFAAISSSLMFGVVVAQHGPLTWKNSHKSIVSVIPTWPGFSRPGRGAPDGTSPEGSGFYFSVNGGKTNIIFTAAHVINNATSIEIINFNGSTYSASLQKIDWKRDIAILIAELEGLSLAYSEKSLEIGSHVCAIGNPFGLGPSLSCGIISGLHRRNLGFNQIEDFIQTDAAVNPGSSGGALVDQNGELLGMISTIYTKDADIDAGVNFVIPLRMLLLQD